jgi:hypothetical protein
MARLNTGLDLLYIQGTGPGFSSCNFVAQILVAIFVLLKKKAKLCMYCFYGRHAFIYRGL